jgi:hypothetical protein
MRYFIKMDLLPEGLHDLREFHGVPVIFRQVFFQEQENE